MAADPADGKNENPLLKKIRETLAHSDPARWGKGGAELEKNARYKTARERWERVYCLETPSGTLVIRESTPVQSKFVGGGYQYLPHGLQSHTVEIRARGWNPRELVDPEYRTQAKGGSSCDVILRDALARELFLQIDLRMRSFHGKIESDFKARVDGLSLELVNRIAATTVQQWHQDAPDKGVLRYLGELNGIKVEVIRRTLGAQLEYMLRFYLGNLGLASPSGSLAQQAFVQIEELGQNQRLSFLSDMLESSLGKR
jgi:hypothetical protein